jgi:phospholipid transport system substrate-binding protein
MFLALVLFLATGAAAPVNLAPDVVVRNVTDEVLAILRADKEGQSANAQNVKQLVESAVRPHFNFTHMTQLAMGRNWPQATAKQQQTLTEEFRTLLVRTYATAIILYGNQTIDYLPLRMATGDTDVIVRSVIRQPANQPVTIDYRMEKLAGVWKAYDVTIDGMSLVQNYRNTFNTEIQKNGIDGLIKALAGKNQELAAQSPR